MFVNDAVVRTLAPGQGEDAAAKGALLTAVHVLAKELGRARIRVNSVVPGAAAAPDAVADAVVFFASDLSAVVTGQTLDVTR